MPGLTPNFAEFMLLNAPTGSNFLVGYDASGSSYIRISITGLANSPVFTGMSGALNATISANTVAITATGSLLVNASGQLATNIAATGAIFANFRTGAIYAQFTPLVNQPPASNFAVLNNRNSIALLDFDESINQSGMFVGAFPYNATLTNGANVDIKWIAATGAGNCIWSARFMPLTANCNLTGDAFALAASGITTALSPGLTAVTSLAVTGISGMLGGDTFRLNIFRNASDVNDTLVGLAEVHSVTVRGI